MKLINIIVFILIIFSFNVVAVEIPNEPSNLVINKIDSEHKNTRLYIQNELTKREKSFMDDFTKRADYYEGSLQDIINKFVFKAGLVLGGIIIFITSLNRLLQNRVEAKKYNVFKKSLKNDIKNEFKDEFALLRKEIVSMPQQDIDDIKKLKIQNSNKNILDKFKKGAIQ